MPSIKIAKNSALSAPECFEKIKQLLENDKELRRLDPQYQCEFDSDQLSGKATGSQFKASLNVTDSGAQGSQMEIIVDLPFHLTLVKGIVQKTLEKKVDQALS